MKKNMGTIDVVIRLMIAVLIAVLLLTKVISVSSWLGIVLLVIAVALLITSLLGFCPLYVPFKINTGKKEETGSNT